MVPAATGERFLDVQPHGGSLVLLRSDRVPHEVLETRRPRICVVGWFRALRQRRHASADARVRSEPLDES